MVSMKWMVFGLLVLFASYDIYNTFVPEGSSESLKLKLLLSINRWVDSPFRMLGRLGIVNYLQFRRITLDYGTRLMNRHTEGVQTEDTSFDGVPVRIYRPDDWNDVTSGPAMVYYHGGGWTIGGVGTHEAVTAYFAQQVNMLVVSVEYRMTPEFSQLDGLDDCVTATTHLISHAKQYRVDPNRVVVAGDSAGGNYAAAVSLKLRDDNFRPMPKIQMLIYPAVQAIDLRLPSYQQNANGPFLDTFDMIWYKSHTCYGNDSGMPDFLAHRHVPDDILAEMAKGILSHDQIPPENKYPPYKPHTYNTGASRKVWDELKHKFLNPYCNPLMSKDHSKLPAAYIFTGQYDLIRDEGFIYAGVLRRAGVEVIHYNHPAGWHGMVNMVKDLKDSKQVMDHMCNYLRKKL